MYYKIINLLQRKIYVVQQNPIADYIWNYNVELLLPIGDLIEWMMRVPV